MLPNMHKYSLHLIGENEKMSLFPNSTVLVGIILSTDTWYTSKPLNNGKSWPKLWIKNQKSLISISIVDHLVLLPSYFSWLTIVSLGKWTISHISHYVICSECAYFAPCIIIKTKSCFSILQNFTSNVQTFCK